MMLIRNGLRSTLRARGRTALFTLLILVLTVALTLGTGMWAYCAAVLREMDGKYTSMALIEYMGEDYPDADAADDGAREALAQLEGAALGEIDGVTLWNRADSTLISLEGYVGGSAAAPYRDNGVVVGTLSPEYGVKYTQISEEDLPADREVKNAVTGDWTFYREGREPLEVPVYSSGEGETYWRTLDSGEQELVEAPDLPWLCFLAEGQGLGVRCTDWERFHATGYDMQDDITAAMMRAGKPQESTAFDYYPEGDVYFGWDQNALLNYRGRVSRTLYTREGKESFLCYFELGDLDFTPEQGKEYLLHGQFVAGNSANRTFAVTEFYAGCETKPWLEIEGKEDPALRESLFVDYANFYRLANNAAAATASDDIPSLEPFQQGSLYLQEGRFPQAGEAGVCLLSGALAERLGKGVGDTVELKVLRSGEWNRYMVEETGDKRNLRVVGVTNPLLDYQGQLWVSGAEGGFSSPLFGYLLGTVSLENARAVAASEVLSARMPPLCRVTLYDQGYSAAAQPIQAMETAAVAVTVTAACGALAVLILFAFLFVGRQKEAVSVLVALGTPRGKIRTWLLSGAAAVAGAAALCGAVIGSASLDRVVAAALETAGQLYAMDTRYSDAAIGIIRESGSTGSIPGWPAWVSGGAVFLAALALCLAFLRQARKENTPKKGKTAVRTPRGSTSVAGRGSLRFALLSARRGGWRSAVVPAAALVLTLFVALLASYAQGWSAQVEQLYAETRLEGQVVSNNGRKQTGLDISMLSVQRLYRSGLIEIPEVSLGWSYWLGDEMPSFGAGGFADETRSAWLREQPQMYAVNGLGAAAEFYYTGKPEVTWLEGWDESFLGGEYPSVLSVLEPSVKTGFLSIDYEKELGVYPALVSERFLREQGLALGDQFTIQFMLPVNQNTRYGSGTGSTTWWLNLQAVGSFPAAGQKDNCYVPLSVWCAPKWLTGEGETDLDGAERGYTTSPEARDRWNYFQTSFGTCRFTLRSAYDLEGLRNYLTDEDFSRVGHPTRNRTTVLLSDQAFVETVAGLGRYISFSEILFPALFLVVGLLGFIISWLMINTRRMEFAVMRGLGASKGRVFRSFFLEQGILCLAGSLAGVAVMALLGSPGASALAGCGFLACYLAGCAVSVYSAGRTNLMVLLANRD